MFIKAKMSENGHKSDILINLDYVISVSPDMGDSIFTMSDGPTLTCQTGLNDVMEAMEAGEIL